MKKSKVIEALTAQAQADRAKALMALDLLENQAVGIGDHTANDFLKEANEALELLTNHPAGIGDHSTKDYWDNCNEALRLLASAEERVEILEKYFNNKEQVNG